MSYMGCRQRYELHTSDKSLNYMRQNTFMSILDFLILSEVQAPGRHKDGFNPQWGLLDGQP